MSNTYDVFARQAHPDFLVHIGSVEADNPEAAAQASLEKFGPESKWIEMVIVPQKEIIVVFSDDGEKKQ